MPRLPDKTLIQTRTDFSTPAVHVADTSAALRGVTSLGNALQAEGKAITKEEQGMELIRADAELDTNLRARERAFDTDTDHKTYETRFGAESNQVVLDAAKGIRDPKMREKWLLSRGQAKQQAALDRVMTRGRGLATEEKEVEVGNILQGYQGRYSETDDPERRRQVLADMDAAIRVGEATGLLRPKTVERLREQYIDGTIGLDAEERIRSGDAEGYLRDRGLVPGGRVKRKVAYGPADLGSVSAKYESGGQGVGFISSGRDDPGGQSYGVHQLSSKDSMPAFLRSPEGRPYAAKFARQVVGSPAFNATYRDIARQDPDGFAKAQFDFYARTHYQPALEAAKAAGFDVTDRGVQEAIFSIGVQHGGARKIIEAAAGAGADTETQIRALYRERAAYVRGLSSLPGRTKQSVLNRYASEERDALKLAGTKGDGAPQADDGDDDGLGLVPWGEATEIQDDTPVRAQYRMLSGKRIRALDFQARVALSAKTQADVKSDIERLANGDEELRDERGETAFDRAQRLLTPNQREKLSQDRDRAIMVRDSIRPMRFMHEDDMESHIDRIGEGMPDDRYGVVGKVRERAVREWEKIRDERRKDPAKAVARHPEVQRTIEMANASVGAVGVSVNDNGDPVIDTRKMTPEQAQRIAVETIEARLQAQELIGVPRSLQRSLSKEQAKRLIVVAPETSGDDLRVELERAAKKVLTIFGDRVGEDGKPIAERVFKDAVALTFAGKGEEKLNEYIDDGVSAITSQLRSERRAQLLAQQLFGKPISNADMSKIQYDDHWLGKIAGAPSLIPSPAEAMNQGQPYIGQSYQAPQARQPNERQSALLLQEIAANPSKAQKYREDFDAKFGEGAAARAINRVMSGEGGGSPPSQAPPSAVPPPPPAPPPQAPSQQDIDAVLKGQISEADFDRKYGAGAAMRAAQDFMRRVMPSAHSPGEGLGQ